MSKFNEVLSKYKQFIKEAPVQTANTIDLSSLDKATGEQIKNGLTELMGNDAEKANQVLQGLVNSKFINPQATGSTNNQAAANPVASQQAATAKVANQTSSPQNNPAVSNSERNSIKQPAI